MSKQIKYIVMEEVNTGRTVIDQMPFTFSDLISHDEMARRFGYPEKKVVSAGFCCPSDMKLNPRIINGVKHYQEEDELTGRIHTIRWKCWGESVSLKVGSRGDEDEKLLNRYYR